MLKTILFVGTGGFLGSVARYLVNVLIQNHFEGRFPLWTFAANILGCFLVGLLYGLFEHGNLMNNDVRSFLIVGFCGGFTTFSTFMHENFNMMSGGKFALCACYLALSLIIGLLACYLGHLVTR